MSATIFKPVGGLREPVNSITAGPPAFVQETALDRLDRRMREILEEATRQREEDIDEAVRTVTERYWRPISLIVSDRRLFTAWVKFRVDEIRAEYRRIVAAR